MHYTWILALAFKDSIIIPLFKTGHIDLAIDLICYNI